MKREYGARGPWTWTESFESGRAKARGLTASPQTAVHLHVVAGVSTLYDHEVVVHGEARRLLRTKEPESDKWN